MKTFVKTLGITSVLVLLTASCSGSPNAQSTTAAVLMPAETSAPAPATPTLGSKPTQTQSSASQATSRFYAEGCADAIGTAGYTYNLCYIGRSEGFYSKVTNAAPGFTDIFYREGKSSGSLKNTTPQRQAPRNQLQFSFHAIYPTDSLVCQASDGSEKLIGTPLDLDDDDNPEYCSVAWSDEASSTQPPGTGDLPVDGVIKFHSFGTAIENIPEATAPALLEALNNPQSLGVFVRYGGTLTLPGACELKAMDSFLIPVEGYKPIC